MEYQHFVYKIPLTAFYYAETYQQLVTMTIANKFRCLTNQKEYTLRFLSVFTIDLMRHEISPS